MIKFKSEFFDTVVTLHYITYRLKTKVCALTPNYELVRSINPSSLRNYITVHYSTALDNTLKLFVVYYWNLHHENTLTWITSKDSLMYASVVIFRRQTTVIDLVNLKTVQLATSWCIHLIKLNCPWRLNLYIITVGNMRCSYNYRRAVVGHFSVRY